MPDNAVTEADSSQAPTVTEIPESEATQPASDPRVDQLLADLAKASEVNAKLTKNNDALLSEKKTQYNKAKEAAKGEEKYQVLSELQAKQIEELETQTSEMGTLRAANDSNIQLATQTVDIKMSTMPDHVRLAVEKMPGWEDANPFDKLQKIEWATAHIPDPTKTVKVPGGGQPPGTTSASDQEYADILKTGDPAKILEYGLKQYNGSN